MEQILILRSPYPMFLQNREILFHPIKISPLCKISCQLMHPQIIRSSSALRSLGPIWINDEWSKVFRQSLVVGQAISLSMFFIYRGKYPFILCLMFDDVCCNRFCAFVFGYVLFMSLLVFMPFYSVNNTGMDLNMFLSFSKSQYYFFGDFFFFPSFQ